MKATGIVTGIISNLVTVRFEGDVAQNEICHIDLGSHTLERNVLYSRT